MKFSWYDLQCILKFLVDCVVARRIAYSIITQIMSAILFGNCSTIEFDCGFFITIVGFSVIPNSWSISWNSCPINSPPVL